MHYFLLLIFLNFIKFSSSTGSHGIVAAESHQNVQPHKNGGFKILLMMPAFDFNRSHMNFAVAIYLVLRKHYHVDFVVPFFIEKDIAYLKNDPKLKDDLIFYELRNGKKKLKETEEEEKNRIEMGKKSLEEKLEKLEAKLKPFKEAKERELAKEKEQQQEKENQQSQKQMSPLRADRTSEGHKNDGILNAVSNAEVYVEHDLQIEEAIAENEIVENKQEIANDDALISLEQMEEDEDQMKGKDDVKSEKKKGEKKKKKGTKGKEEMKNKNEGEKEGEKKEEEKKDPVTLEDILKQDSFGKRMDYFQDIWIDMIESDFLKDSHYDLGITEISHPSQYAFAVFEWLGIKRTIVTKNYSPGAQQYADLGLMKAFLNANLASVGRVNVGDHRNFEYETRQEQFAIDFALQLNGANEELKKCDEKFDEKIRLQLSHFNKDGLPAVRNYFKSATAFLVNTQPELEFDMGQIMLMNGGNGGKVQMIGGIHLDEDTFGQERRRPKKPLDQKPEIASLIEQKINAINGFQGIVLISFGSVVDTKKARPKILVQLDAIRATIRKMPKFFFIWHLTAEDPQIEEINKEEPNVYAAGWLDLKAILADPRTKAFMSHCGKNSFFESIYFGVPLLCVPIFSDQFYNAETAAKHQLAVVLDFFCIEMEIDDGKGGKTMQMFKLQHHKASGSTGLEEFSEEFFMLTKEEQYHEFLEINQEKNYSRNKNGESRMSAEKEKYEYCFTKEHIVGHLKEAINAKKERQNKSHRINWDNLMNARAKFHSMKKPHHVVLETVHKIEQEIHG